MGLFDALSNLASATVKIAVTPIAVAKDVVNVAIGEEAEATKNLIKSAGNDIEKAGDEIA